MLLSFSIRRWGLFRKTEPFILIPKEECNVRSKTWWFTEPCNSHYVSHFAAFFIVAGTKRSIVQRRGYWSALGTLGTRALIYIGYNGIVSSESRKNPAERGKQNQSRSLLFLIWEHTPCYRREFTGFDLFYLVSMILPQVHLRKPCYDFSFL